MGVPYCVKANDVFYFKDGNLTWLKKFKSNVFGKYIYYWITSPIGQKAIDDISISKNMKHY